MSIKMLVTLLGTLVLVLLLGLAAPACNPPATPAPAAVPGEKGITKKTKADWEEKWENALAGAKREGMASIYSGWAPAHRTALTNAFSGKYGIGLEFTPYGKGEELLAKVQAESRAGLYLSDVYGGGNTTLLITLKPAGVLGSLKPLIILPEVLDSKAWLGGRVPFTDEGGFSVSMTGYVVPAVAYNTDLVKEGELTSVKDLLKPQYKGKITLSDPSVTGASNAILSHLSHNLWGEAETLEFVRHLIKQQEAFIQRDNRIQVESVARGKYAIAFGMQDTVLAEFVRIGAPIKRAMLEEDNRVATGSGALGVAARMAHPNATTVFVNWLLTKEGQSVFATTFGSASNRIDASTEGIDPPLVPKPGKKYFSENEELMSARDKWLGLGRKLVEEAAK